MTHAALGPGGEFDRIRAIWRRLGEQLSPAGDDCALVSVGGIPLAISTDATIEGTHFRAGWLSPAELGWRATSAALSDLAAVAATPAGVLVSLGVAPEWPEEMVVELMAGVGEAAAAAGASVWGGDLVGSERLVIDVTVVGRADEAVPRCGAVPGDELWVTGRLGAPAAALAAWSAGVEPDRAARERFARPVPRLEEARWLRERGARAMIDLSDGLLGDAAHLAAASDVRVVIERELVPVHPAAGDAERSLVSGEEYELLAALPAGFGADDARAFEEVHGLPLTRVGRVEAGSGLVLLADGAPAPPPAGYQQF